MAILNKKNNLDQFSHSLLLVRFGWVYIKFQMIEFKGCLFFVFIFFSIQMETTPRTRNSTRYRRVPTPKMSERKKKLFEDVLNNGDSPSIRNPYVRLERLIIEEGEDSDLGPMSPLEFSSSPSSFNEVHRIIARDGKCDLRGNFVKPCAVCLLLHSL